jgi:quercetin dioxygenase-like cupin family protein
MTAHIVRLEDLEKKPLRDGMGHVEGEFWEVFTKTTASTEALRLLVQWYPPGGYTRNHPVHNDFEQAYYVISGTMTVFLEDEEHLVPTGSFVFIPRGTRHHHQNDGDEPMVFLTINVPVRDGNVPPVESQDDAAAVEST